MFVIVVVVIFTENLLKSTKLEQKAKSKKKKLKLSKPKRSASETSFAEKNKNIKKKKQSEIETISVKHSIPFHINAVEANFCVRTDIISEGTHNFKLPLSASTFQLLYYYYSTITTTNYHYCYYYY